MPSEVTGANDKKDEVSEWIKEHCDEMDMHMKLFAPDETPSDVEKTDVEGEEFYKEMDAANAERMNGDTEPIFSRPLPFLLPSPPQWWQRPPTMMHGSYSVLPMNIA